MGINQKLTSLLSRGADAGVSFQIHLEEGLLLNAEGVLRSEDYPLILRHLRPEAEWTVFHDRCYCPIRQGDAIRAIFSVEDTEVGRAAGKLMLPSIRELYDPGGWDEERNEFFRLFLSKNVFREELRAELREKHVRLALPRIVFLFEIGREDDGTAERIISEYFSEETNGFLFPLDKTQTILIREVREGETEKDFSEIAEGLVEMLRSDAVIDARAGFGTVVPEWHRIPESYREARKALEIGRIFAPEQAVYSISGLGIGRLIYELPVSLCESFLSEVFDGRPEEILDEETETTLSQFLRNDLNVSETARALFIHRNTLVYRLDKLQKQTGRDVRVFKDAILFEMALWVRRYLRSLENQE